MMIFIWKPEKNEWLKKERGISFEEIVEALAQGAYRDILEYRGRRLVHQGQRILILEIVGELWKVSHSLHGEFIFLRTAYPVYLKGVIG